MSVERPLLGVVHLHALPSAVRHRSMQDVLDAALADAEAFASGGCDGLVIENFGDAPFHRGTLDDPVPPDVVAGLAVVGDRLQRATGLPLCINCLRNDGLAALGIAAALGARWVRVNVLTGAYVTDQGLIAGDAARLCAYRRQLGTDTQILGDFLVKHAAPVAPIDVAAGARDLAERSGAAGLVLSGARTGEAVGVALLDTVRSAVDDFPIWLGAGLSPDNAAQLWPRCDGAIVGSWCKVDGRVGNPVDAERVRILRAVCVPGPRRSPR